MELWSRNKNIWPYIQFIYIIIKIERQVIQNTESRMMLHRNKKKIERKERNLFGSNFEGIGGEMREFLTIKSF